MAELADAPASGAGLRKEVQVQVLLPAGEGEFPYMYWVRNFSDSIFLYLQLRSYVKTMQVINLLCMQIRSKHLLLIRSSFIIY